MKYIKKDSSSPFQASMDIKGLTFTGKYTNYTDADTWYLSWGADDCLYSPFTDTIGNGVNGVMSRSDHGKKSVVGHCIVTGNDPMNLKFNEPGVISSPSKYLRYRGRYPSASLHHDGVWYIGTYALADKLYGLNWPVMGPFAGFHISKDNGKTWIESPLSGDVKKGLFSEPQKFKGPIKLGAPHVVDFGKNMEHSPDGKMYMCAHGTQEFDGVTRRANCSWITGDEVYMCRVTPTPEKVNDVSEYEFFCGHDDNQEAIWSNDFSKIKPIAAWKSNMGSAAMTYVPQLKKYLMCVTDGWPTIQDMDSYILESDNITGPFRMVKHLKAFGPQGYFLNFPSKFISEDGKKLWLCYSANFAHRDFRGDPLKGTPIGSSYSMSLQEIELDI